MNGGVTHDWWTAKSLEGSGRSLLETHFRNFFGGADRNRENTQLAQSVPRVRFEPSTSPIQVPIDITTSICPATSTYLALLRLHFSNILSCAKVTIDAVLDWWSDLLDSLVQRVTTIHCYAHTSVLGVTSSLSLRGSGFQRRMFLLLWATDC
jgi:hypothetical protein